MNFRFKELFRVEFRHRYFGEDALYNGLAVKPSVKTRDFFLNNRLLFKATNAGFIIGYETGGQGDEESRAAILKTEAVLIFRLDLTDPYLYNYTGNLPNSISGLVFHFWNYHAIEETHREKGMLQADAFIGKGDMNNTGLLAQVKDKINKKAIAEKANTGDHVLIDKLIKAELKTDEFINKPYSSNIILLDDYFSKPFGQISIKLNSNPSDNFAEKFVLQFDALATHWQYILRSEHLTGITKPAVINNKTNLPEFEEPVPLTLPDDKPAVSISSKTPIMLTNAPQRKYRLVKDFDAVTNSFKEFNPPLILPDPDVNAVSSVTKMISDDIEKKYSIIIL